MTGARGRRWVGAAVRTVVVVAWVFTVLVIADRGVSKSLVGVVALVVSSSVTLGVLIDRWWAAATPFVLATGFAVYAFATQTDAQEVASVYIAMGAYLVALVIAVPLAAGVGIRVSLRGRAQRKPKSA